MPVIDSKNILDFLTDKKEATLNQICRHFKAEGHGKEIKKIEKILHTLGQQRNAYRVGGKYKPVRTVSIKAFQSEIVPALKQLPTNTVTAANDNSTIVANIVDNTTEMEKQIPVEVQLDNSPRRYLRKGVKKFTIPIILGGHQVTLYQALCEVYGPGEEFTVSDASILASMEKIPLSPHSISPTMVNLVRNGYASKLNQRKAGAFLYVVHHNVHDVRIKNREKLDIPDQKVEQKVVVLRPPIPVKQGFKNADNVRENILFRSIMVRLRKHISTDVVTEEEMALLEEKLFK